LNKIENNEEGKGLLKAMIEKEVNQRKNWIVNLKSFCNSNDLAKSIYFY
jgi:hypothetical protein